MQKKTRETEKKGFLHKARQKLKWIDPFTYVDLFVMPKINPSNNEYASTLIYVVFAFLFAWIFYTLLGIAFATSSPMVIVMSGSMEPLYHRGDVIVLFGANNENIQAQQASLGNATLKNIPLVDIAAPKYSQSSTNPAGFDTTALVFKNGTEIPIEKTGTIVVYNSTLTSQPIIHRAIAKVQAEDGYYVLTKGDSTSNPTIDQDCGRIINYGTAPAVSVGTEKPCITLYPIKTSELQGKAVFQVPFVGCFKLWLFDDLFSLLSKGKLPSDFKGIC